MLVAFLLVTLAVVPKGMTQGGQTSGDAAEISLVEVQLKQGLIKGKKVDVGDGHYIYSFKSIPFAQPPVGDLRLRDPVPAASWGGVRDGTVDPSPCVGLDPLRYLKYETKVIGTEDCLYLNVLTPEINVESRPLPVMVWIYGGVFMMGSASLSSFRPEVIRDVVIVVPQYRLAALGFLSTGDSVLPGNYGLKDQTLALRWIQENIRDLGGDPNRVTLFGSISGAMSIHLQMLSEHGKGLFQRAILHSGTALTPYLSVDDDVMLQTTQKLGKRFECPSNESAALLECFQAVPAEELTLASTTSGFGILMNLMLPRVDGDFLTDEPVKLLKNGSYNKVDLISGIVRDEGAFMVKLWNDRSVFRENLLYNFSVAGPEILALKSADETPIVLAEEIFMKYVGEMKPDHIIDLRGLEKLTKDRNVAVPHDEMSLLHSRDNHLGKKVFAYELKYQGPYGLAAFLQDQSIKDFIAAGDEMQFFFNYGPMTQTPDLQVKEAFIKMWTNFAATGNPTPDDSLGFRWDPVTSPTACLRHLDILPSPTMQDDTRFEIRQFWKHLPLHTNKILYPDIFSGDSQVVEDPDSKDPCTTYGSWMPFSGWSAAIQWFWGYV